MQPFNARGKKDMIRDLAIRNYGDKDAQRVLSETFYDPQKLTYNEQLKIRKQQAETFSSTAPIKEYPTQAETQAAKFLDFATTINDDKPRPKRWRNQSYIDTNMVLVVPLLLK